MSAREATRYLSAALGDGMAVMAMGFIDADPVITCVTGGGCGMTFRGDAAVDAWRIWYKHLAENHPGWGE